MFVVVTLNVQELPKREAPVIQLIVLSDPSTISQDVQVQTPTGSSKQYDISRQTKAGLTKLNEAVF